MVVECSISRPSSPSILIKSKKYEVAASSKKTKKPPDKGPQLEINISKMSLNESNSGSSRSGSAKSRKGSGTVNSNNSTSKLTKFFTKTKLIKSTKNTSDTTERAKSRGPPSTPKSRFNFRKKSVAGTGADSDKTEGVGLVKKVRALVSRKDNGNKSKRPRASTTTPVTAFDKFGGSEPHLPTTSSATGSSTPYGYRPEAVSVMSLTSSATASSKGTS